MLNAYLFIIAVLRLLMLPFKMFLVLPIKFFLGDFTQRMNLIEIIKRVPDRFEADMRKMPNDLTLALYWMLWIYMHLAIVSFFLLHSFQFWVVPWISSIHPGYTYVADEFLPSTKRIDIYYILLQFYTTIKKGTKIYQHAQNPEDPIWKKEAWRGLTILFRWISTVYIISILAQVFNNHIVIDDLMYEVCMKVITIFGIGEAAELGGKFIVNVSEKKAAKVTQ